MKEKYCLDVHSLHLETFSGTDSGCLFFFAGPKDTSSGGIANWERMGQLLNLSFTSHAESQGDSIQKFCPE
jgi:hypothetical protein